MRAKIIYFVIALAILSQSSWAGAEARNAYVVMKAGVYLPYDYGYASTSVGPAAELAIGYLFTPHFGVEGGLGYYQTDVKDLFFNSKFKNEGTPVTVSFKGIQRGENFVSSIGFGVGTYSEDVRTVSGAAIVNGKESVLGYHLSIGYDFHLGDRLYGGFEYRLLSIRDAEFLTLYDRSIYKMKIDMSGSALFSTLGWRF